MRIVPPRKHACSSGGGGFVPESRQVIDDNDHLLLYSSRGETYGKV